MATLRRQAVKVGVFVATVVMLLLLALLVIGGLSFWRMADTYYVVTDQAVSGINVNSIVTLRGVEIGRVESIELDRDNLAQVTIGLEIDPDIPIPAESRAYFERVGLTGERTINISGGTLAAGRIPPGSVIPRGETELERLEQRATELGDELASLIEEATATVEQIEAVVDAVDPERVAAIIDAVDPERVESIVVHAERSAKTIAATGRRLGRAVTETRADIERIGDEAYEELDEVTDEAEEALNRIGAAAMAFEDASARAEKLVATNEDEVRETLRDLRRAARDAAALLDKLREQPSLLLRSPRKQRKQRKNRDSRRRSR